MRLDIRGFGNLIGALCFRFPAEEARQLAQLLGSAVGEESVTYEEIDVPADLKDDILLIAYEERMILPMKSMGGSAWEDRILGLRCGERYHLPRVVRFLVHHTCTEGQWNPGKACREALMEAGEPDADGVTGYLARLKAMAPKYEIEVPVMQAIAREMSLALDMHDMLDRFVRCGIMSPRPQRSLRSVIPKYEMNPCLYWQSGTAERSLS